MSTSASANNFGCRKGAGEQLSLFSDARPRVLIPGDTVPFIGVLRDRHNDHRRHIVNQWRNLRRRTSPTGGVTKPRTVSPTQRDRLMQEDPEPSTSQMGRTTQNQDTCPDTHQFQNDTLESTREKCHQRPKTADTNKTRDKSPKTVLREVKNKLKTKDSIKQQAPTTARDKSPNSVLREAKLRLRKLEIEAEAVEKSYFNFRKRQAELRKERTSFSMCVEEPIVKDVENFETKRSNSPQKRDDERQKNKYQSESAQNVIKNDFDKYLKEYQTKYNIGETYFKNKNIALKRANPIPETYSEVENTRHPDNYLETPITEFRKLYYSNKSRYSERSDENKMDNKHISSNKIDSEKSLDSNCGKFEIVSSSEPQKETHGKLEKTAELEILKNNINKIYDLPDESEDIKIQVEGLRDEPLDDQITEDKNLLRVEFDSVSELNDIKITDSQTQDLLLLVQSPIDVRDTLYSNSDEEKLSPQMTIIVSPRRNSPKGPNDVESKKSLSPDQSARSTRNDVIDSIFRADGNQLSSIQMHLELSKDTPEDSIIESEKGEAGEEYPDDFSADVDNYNSRSDYGNNSPISMPKTSEDENFWDS